MTYVPAPLSKFGQRHRTTNWTPRAITLAELHQKRDVSEKNEEQWQFHLMFRFEKFEICSIQQNRILRKLKYSRFS